MPNRLAGETSPYLLQHAENPVDWYPWGDEALAMARALDRPILLSIGYSACHWCHVMAHESFEDPEVASLMNENFINVKVDREERPDLDAIYMRVTVAISGGGGWPMTVFLTPSGVPFYAGTYFPPGDRFNIPSFRRVLDHVTRTYRERPEAVEKTTRSVSEFLASGSSVDVGESYDETLLNRAFLGLVASFDEQNGGFGGAPKFPPAMALDFLLRHHERSGDTRALEIVESTLIHMARGGLRDQVGGGFHRYSVDATWLVPHFEKMLYDNALLARAYTDAWLATGQRFYRTVAESTLDYVIREMTSPEGGFYSAQDADSEGVEGKFYVWMPNEIQAVLGPTDGPIVADYLDVTVAGNWEHRSIPNLKDDPGAIAARHGVSVESLRALVDRSLPRLRDARSQRIAPGRDEKILASWNGLMLRAMAHAATVLGSDRFRRSALANGTFLMDALVRDGRARHVYARGVARQNGFLEDYAYVADGFLALYELTFAPRWLLAARSLVDSAIAHFADDERGGFYDTSDDHETLIARPKDLYDNATPSANAVLVDVMARLAHLCGDEEYARRAADAPRAIAEVATQSPSAFGRWLSAIDEMTREPIEVAIIGDPESGLTGGLLQVVRQRYMPGRVIAVCAPGDAEATALVPFLRDRAAIDARPTAYLCRRFVCQPPTTEARELARQLDGR
ncbi:MAG: thioredoxin domain-containing protein [Chloroflexota bacterium]|nr:MAG: thioredoxin domain-containing protein [Chloroflexota bacterium]